jgi:hypothetical protein
MVLISKDREKTKAVATKIAADDWEELVVCFKNRIGQPLKTKSA